MDRIAPSARLEAQIAELLTQGPAVDRKRLAGLGRVGARLVLQRAVDEEVAAMLLLRPIGETGSSLTRSLNLRRRIEVGCHDTPLPLLSATR